ncbi:MAG: hypothetical protein U9N53_03600 [Bacteroidota bacterium]|nr:hypothetical protein [Bacteroidota bacterium]
MKTREVKLTEKTESFDKFFENVLNTTELLAIRGGDGEEDGDPDVIIVPILG